MRNLFHSLKPAFLMMEALKLGKSLGLHGDDSAYRESAWAPGHRERVSADLRQSSFNVDPLQITIQTTKQSKIMLNPALFQQHRPIAEV